MKNFKYYVYHIHFDGMTLDEGYVGISRNPKERWRKHRKKNAKSIVSGKIRKYPDKIRYTILAQFDTEDEARWLEYCLRPQKNIGWNIAIGGAKCPMDGIRNHTEETRKKMSKSHKGAKLSKEHCEAISKANKGRKLSDRHKKKMLGKNVGHKSGKAKPVNLYDFYTDELVAEDVVIREWCRENGFINAHTGLYASLRADHTKPSSKTNVRHSKGIYARYVEDGPPPKR